MGRLVAAINDGNRDAFLAMLSPDATLTYDSRRAPCRPGLAGIVRDRPDTRAGRRGVGGGARAQAVGGEVAWLLLVRRSWRLPAERAVCLPVEGAVVCPRPALGCLGSERRRGCT